MAIVKNADSSRLTIKVQTGMGTNGKPVLKNRIFADIKAAATDEAVYEVAAGLAGLQTHPVDAILREDNGVLVQV